MARKRKGVVINNVYEKGVNAEDIAEKVATKVAEKFALELKKVLASMPVMRGQKSVAFDEIGVVEMDERIIPMDVRLEDVDHNLEGAAKEEVKTDDALQSSKGKLASLLKK